MAVLAISSQDIRQITLGLLTDEGFVEKTFQDTSPEQHLLTLDAFLKDAGVAKSAIDSVVVVTGPGSFTASRVSTTIANALAFVLCVPVRGVENSERLSLEVCVRKAMDAKGDRTPFATPTYDKDPHITSPK